MLETKKFDEFKNVATQLRVEFLELYFGQNEEVISFAQELFKDGRTDILLELNRAVKVLGKSNAGEAVIIRIKTEFNYRNSIAAAEQAALNKVIVVALLAAAAFFAIILQLSKSH